jgi:4-alpha-glucanotransferase
VSTTASRRAGAELSQLATDLGVEVAGVATETLLAIVNLLGADIRSPEEAAAARRALQRRRFERAVEPVVVAWDDARPTVTVYVDAAFVDAPFRVVVEAEGGVTSEWGRSQCLGVVRSDVADGVQLELELPEPVPFGVHRLLVDGPRVQGEAALICAPLRTAGPSAAREWGVFAPLYALHEEGQSGTGDLATLRRFARWAAGAGAGVVATLPLLATFVGHGEEPLDPSPYAPVSRRFWNEVYLPLPSQIREPSPGATVDLAALAAHRRRALEDAAAAARDDPVWLAFLAARPEVLAYARFRAARERGGEVGDDDPAVRYHAYVQWRMDVELDGLAAELRSRGQVLNLDLPVGAHREGYDVASEPDLFLRDTSVGAPPDAFYAGGQNWGFPPVHPDAGRRTGYRYLRACLAAHFRHAGLLRLDHVMGLHRLWLIPPGAEPAQGAYVRYAGDEQWAVVCLEAARHGAGVVGEDLGTVPEETERSLRRHNALGMWVAQFEVTADGVIAPGAHEVAAVGTHDLPTFATWWHDLAPEPRGEVLDTLRDAQVFDADDGDAVDPAHVLEALLTWLGASDAAVVLVALEDLWLETEPQNRPGVASHQNFCRRAAYGLDDLEALEAPRRVLHRLHENRRAQQHVEIRA